MKTKDEFMSVENLVDAIRRIDFDSVKEKASYITPVPGGIGPMTIAMLISNVLEAYRKHQQE